MAEVGVLAGVLFAAFAWAGAVLPGSDVPLAVDEDTRLVVASSLAAMDSGHFDAAADALDQVPGAQARYLEALARYEQGDLFASERALRAGLALDPGLAPLHGLLGLVLADLGRGDDAISSLDQAIHLAQIGGDAEVQARALLNRGVVRSDRGEPDRAAADWHEAQQQAESAGLGELAAEAADQIRSLSDAVGGDLVGRVAEQVRRGDLKGAAALIPAVDTSPRDKVHALIARGMIARSEGNIDTAAAWLREAIDTSDALGMVREGLSARIELAYVLLAVGSVDATSSMLHEALHQADGTSFVVRTIEVHLGLARLAARTGDAVTARREWSSAQQLAAHATHPMLPAALAEVDAIVRGVEGDLLGGAAAADRAASAWDAVGAPTDAARAACEQMRLLAQAGADRDAARTAALARFAALGDRRGPAHVGISEGLGAAASAHWSDAIEAYARAYASARDTGDAGLEQLARTNVMDTLRAAGHSQAAMDAAAARGFSDAVAWHARWEAARAQYATGQAAFTAGHYADAVAPLDAARKEFEVLGEGDDAIAARRAVAWSRYNVVVKGTEEAGLPVFESVIADAVAVSDTDLALHARLARAVAMARLGRPGATQALAEVADAATKQPVLAAAAWAARGRIDALPLDDRAVAARTALGLDKGDTSAASMYDVAYDAYQANRFDLALALTTELLPFAGGLEHGVRDLHDAARDALGDGAH